MIDLRSDTVTKPTPEMRKAMANALVGDDVFGEDPTANALQEKIAALFGFEAGLFVPSGVMGNQISLNLLTSPGDEVIIDEKGHMFNYEITSAAHLSSIQFRPVQGTRGKLTADLICGAERSGLYIEPKTKAVVIENTTNKGGGACYSISEIKGIYKATQDLGLAIHLDGARIWNALEATRMEPEIFGSIAATMSVCFSKGLGAPVGSMILSSKEKIDEARRIRKMLGGGMRQIGILAAAADHAIENHRSFLKDDHRRARELAVTIEECSDLSISPETVETNILIFDVLQDDAQQAAEKLAENDIYLTQFGPKTLRATFHFQISDKDLQQVQTAFFKYFG